MASPRRCVRLRAAEGARGTVEFDHVSFAYQGEDWVLEDVTFRVAPGERVAIVGATGAGKTTIIKLLTRLYDPTRGRILLDGVDLRDLPPVRSAPPGGDGAPGRLPVQRDDRGEHRGGPSRGGPREHRAGGARRARRSLHRDAPAGLRHAGARARQQLLGRRAPAALLRAGARPRRRRARARRGHQLDRQRDRGPDRGGDPRPAGRAGPRS